MKYAVIIALISTLISCAVQEPYTNKIRDEFSLDTEEKLSKVQFFLSSTIVLDEEIKNENSTTTSNGVLINSSNSQKETVIIQAGTKGIFDSYGANGEMLVRFEVGEGKLLKFSSRSEASIRYYFDVDWNKSGGPKVQYGGKTFKVDVLRGNPQNAYLKIARKKLEKIKRKDRFVRGMKV